MRLRLFQIVNRAQNNDQVSRWYDFFIVSVAFISIIPLMFKQEHMTPEIEYFLHALDIVTVFILFSDYVFRWITHDLKSGKGIKSFVRYPFTPIAIIDLLSILPSITILNDSLKFLRVLRMVRIMRMLPGLTILTNVFIRERKALLSVVFFICAYVFTVGLIMFTVEPDTFNTFLDALYWSTTALATIGYGDITPVSSLGKTLAIVSSIVGIAVVAFPAGIITGGYITQLQKAKQKGREYFMLPVKHDKTFKGKPITSYKNLRSYIKRNKKVAYYTLWIAIGVAISVTSTMFTEYSPYSVVFFDEFGTVLISVILEPAAGIVVGLINDVIYAVTIDSAYCILFFGCAAMYAVVFGVYFRRGRTLTVKSFVMVILVCTIFNSIYMYLVVLFSVPDFLENSFDITVDFAFEYEAFSKFLEMTNMDYNVAIYSLYFATRLTYLVIALVSVLLIRRYFWGSKIDPMMKIPVRKRYKFKVYRKKSTHSYIKTWIEENVGEDEDDVAELEDIVSTGKESIETSKKQIRKKKEKIDVMQQEVEEKLADIEQQKEDIVKHEEAIDVKKKAVRRVKRKIAMEDPDSLVPNIPSVINKPVGKQSNNKDMDETGEN